MAWTDYSNTDASLWTSFFTLWATNPGLVADITDPLEPEVAFNHFNLDYPFRTIIDSLANNYGIPGFDDGFSPNVPSPIANNIDEGGGGGSTRPTSGMIYPRGTG